MEKINAVITGVGGYVPNYILDNEEMSHIVDTSDEWIMERIGVNALDIAEIIPYVADSPLKTQVPILMMADAASYMVSKSVEAFVDKNIELADSVIAYDDTVDDLFDEVKSSIIESIRDGKKKDGSVAIDIVMIAKYFERMGDHAENIAKLVHYSLNE